MLENVKYKIRSRSWVEAGRSEVAEQRCGGERGWARLSLALTSASPPKQIAMIDFGHLREDIAG